MSATVLAGDSVNAHKSTLVDDTEMASRHGELTGAHDTDDNRDSGDDDEPQPPLAGRKVSPKSISFMYTGEPLYARITLASDPTDPIYAPQTRRLLS